MASENSLWGAERIRGELLKLHIHIAKRTIQRYIKPIRPTRPSSQRWSTFLKTHARDIWSCDFLPVINVWFQTVYLYFIIEQHTRQVVHVGLTRHPTENWVAQQLREATMEGFVNDSLAMCGENV